MAETGRRLNPRRSHLRQTSPSNGSPLTNRRFPGSSTRCTFPRPCPRSKANSGFASCTACTWGWSTTRCRCRWPARSSTTGCIWPSSPAYHRSRWRSGANTPTRTSWTRSTVCASAGTMNGCPISNGTSKDGMPSMSPRLPQLSCRPISRRCGRRPCVCSTFTSGS